METIDLDQYQEAVESLSQGEQINVNHKDCPAGVDTRKRLYIKRTTAGAILAYCHHCNSKAYLTKQGRALKSISALKSVVSTELTANSSLIPYFSTLEEIDKEKPPYFKAWLAKFGYFGSKSRKDLGHFIRYSMDQGRVYYPYWNKLSINTQDKLDFLIDKADPDGYQSRSINLNCGKTSKYITHRTNPSAESYSLIEVAGRRLMHWPKQMPYPKPINVLVEDLVSQYCIALAGMSYITYHGQAYPYVLNVWCCMGTSLNATVATKLVKSIAIHGEGAVPLVWYDPDSAGKVATMKAQKDIGQIVMHKTLDEPKYMSTFDVYAHLHAHITKRGSYYALGSTATSNEEQGPSSEDRSSDQGTHSQQGSTGTDQ